MSYVPVSAKPVASLNYSPVPETDTVVTDANPSVQEERLMSISSTWVISLCFFQMGLSIFSFLFDGFFSLLFAVIFVPFGLIGVRKRKSKFLLVHFLYSLVLYIFAWIDMFSIIFYCQSCQWWIYLLSFSFLFFQALGIKYSRILIGLSSKYYGSHGLPQHCRRRSTSRGDRCSPPSNSSSVNDTPLTSSVPTENSSIPLQQFSPNGPQPTPFYTMLTPGAYPQQMPQQFANFPSPNYPQFVQWTPVQYPLVQQPIPLSFTSQQQQPYGI